MDTEETALSLLKQLKAEITTPFRENDVAMWCVFCGKNDFSDDQWHKPGCIWPRIESFLVTAEGKE